MIPATLSYSQSLRVIGQALEVLRINTFTLEKSGEKYIVRNWEPSFLRSITEKVWGPGDDDRILCRSWSQPPSYMVSISPMLLRVGPSFISSDTNRLEALGQSRRDSDSDQEGHNLSLALRVVGLFGST
jgi:hypothetical protein